MNRTYKYRLCPNTNQEKQLFQWLRLTRELYNACIQERRDAWKKQQINVRRFDQTKQLADIRRDRKDLAGVPIVVLRGAILRADRAFQAFFRRCKTRKSKAGYPRFKSAKHFNSLSIDDLKQHNPIIDKGHIKIPFLGEIKLKHHRPITGVPKVMVISLDSDGKWYVSLTCINVSIQPLPPTNKEVGIDLGLISVVATSDGAVFGNPRTMRNARIKLERLQRKVSRQKKGSNRRKKTIRQLAKTHHHLTQVKRQNHIDIANYLIRNYDTIYIEDLNLNGLSRGMLSKSFHQTSLSTFTHWLSVKAESAGRQIVKVDPKHTSQLCSGCGVVVPKALSGRIHNCPKCGLVLDRDINAAINIKRAGQVLRLEAMAVGIPQRSEKSKNKDKIRVSLVVRSLCPLCWN